MKNIGLWIDDQEAIIVTLQNGREETQKNFSVVEKPVRVPIGKRPNLTFAAPGLTAAIEPAPCPADPVDIYLGGSFR